MKMLFNKTTNKTLINGFNILTEVIIGFGTFALFFGIFMNYVFTKYEVELLGKFVKESVSFYKGNPSNKQSQDLHNQMKTLINSNSDVNNLEKNVSADDEYVHSYNKPYDNKLMYIILGMIFGLLGLLLIPVILGFIRLEQINFKYIGLSLVLHIILIVGFELLFLLYIITFINPVKLYSVFESNYQKHGYYL